MIAVYPALTRSSAVSSGARSQTQEQPRRKALLRKSGSKVMMTSSAARDFGKGVLVIEAAEVLYGFAELLEPPDLVGKLCHDLQAH